MIDGGSGYLGRILDPDGQPVGTCFQAAPGVLITAHHVMQDAGAGEPGLSVTFDDFGEGAMRSAVVVAIAPHDDLAVLTTDSPLAESIGRLASPRSLPLGRALSIRGLADLEGADAPGLMPAQGTWSGFSRPDGVHELGVIESTAILKGMSGAPVLRAGSDHAMVAVGVLSSRYNPTDGHGRNNAWFATTDQLSPLLESASLGDAVMIEQGGGRPDLPNVLLQLDRPALADDPVFVTESAWGKLWEQARAALADNSIVVAVAPSGFGGRTFAQQLLARGADEASPLFEIDAEDANSVAGLLSKRYQEAYYLELREEDENAVGPGVVARLGEFSRILHDHRSRMAISIPTTLWDRLRGHSDENVHVARLMEPPSAFDLVKVVLETRGIAVEFADGDLARLRDAPEGRDAYEALRAVEAVVQSQQRDAQESRDWVARSDAVTDILVSVLTDFGTKLDHWFGSPGGKPLTLDQRRLALALALWRKAPISILERHARLPLTGEDSRPLRSAELLAGAGLRVRVETLDAVVDMQDNAAFTAPELADAVLNYVWKQYEPLRADLARWMLLCRRRTCSRRAHRCGPRDPASAAAERASIRGTA